MTSTARVIPTPAYRPTGRVISSPALPTLTDAPLALRLAEELERRRAYRASRFDRKAAERSARMSEAAKLSTDEA